MRAPFLLAIILTTAGCGSSPFAEGVPVIDAPQRSGSARITGSGLIQSRVDGMGRNCLYRNGPIGNALLTHRVGLADRCPRNYPAIDPNAPVNPAAPLKEASIEAGRRLCVYVQGNGRWRFTLPIMQNCPINAGMAARAETLAKADDPNDE